MDCNEMGCPCLRIALIVKSGTLALISRETSPMLMVPEMAVCRDRCALKGLSTRKRAARLPIEISSRGCHVCPSRPITRLALLTEKGEQVTISDADRMDKLLPCEK